MAYQGRHFSPASGDSQVAVPSRPSLRREDSRSSGHLPYEEVLPKPILLVFVALVMALCVSPFAGMLAGGKEIVNSDGSVDAAPALFADGSLNTDYLRSLGSYFEEHMAFKNELITADATLRARLFGVSNTKQVIVGKEGWIYYGGTLNDYLGADELTDRELENIAFNLSMIGGYVRSHGARFVVAIAPNKNTVYPEYMPAWLLASEGQHNAERLLPYLDQYGVTYADLISVLRSEKDEGLYFLRDSHWNDQGALLAYNAILDAIGMPHETYDGVPFVEAEHAGDIDAMLYPAGDALEAVPALEGGYDFSFVGSDDDVTANLIETTGKGSAKLLMYRDSFANNLLQPLSAAFASSTFTNLVPYDLGKVEQLQPQLVIIERAERHLSDLDHNIPILPAPSVSVVPEASVDVPATISVDENGPFTVISGDVDISAIADGLVDDDTGFYVQIVTASETLPTLTAFRATVEDASGTNPYGFEAYVPTAILPDDPYQIRLIAQQGGVPVIVAQLGMNQEV